MISRSSSRSVSIGAAADVALLRRFGVDAAGLDEIVEQLERDGTITRAA